MTKDAGFDSHATSEDIIQVFRLIEYRGPLSLVAAQVANSIHGTRYGLPGQPLEPHAWPPIGVPLRHTRVRITSHTFEGLDASKRKLLTDLLHELRLGRTPKLQKAKLRA